MYASLASWINRQEFGPAVLNLGPEMSPRDRTRTGKVKKADLLSEKQSGPEASLP
jgi:hypothetical protein